MAHNFRRLAGSFHYEVKSFADLVAAAQVPEAHWIATACPTSGMNCDPKFLAALDTDHNGRVRAEEMKAAVAWLAGMLKNPESAAKGSDEVALDNLSDKAAQLKETALYVLRGLGAADGKINLAQVRSIAEVQTRVSANGDGIITPTGVSDADLKALIPEILSVFPGAKDASGDQGVDRDTVAAFGKAREAAVAWLDDRAAKHPWGEDSVAVARQVLAVKARVDEYFLQCRLVASQPSAAERFRLSPEAVDAVVGDASALGAALSRLPLAPPDPAGVLHWAKLYRGASFEAMKELQAKAGTALGPAAAEGLTEADWATLSGTAGGVAAWGDAEAGHAVLKLGGDRLRAIQPELLAKLDQACADDAAVSDTLARVQELEKLVLLHRWLFILANNFVAMPFLYDATRTAIFEQGELVLAGRNFPFSTLVENRGAHAGIALQSSCFLMYVGVSGAGRTFEVCVPVTAGTSDGLFVGKRGIFRTVDGVEMDAIVTQIISNPVSIYEAITSPFNRIVSFVEQRVQSWADKANADFDSAVNKNLDSAQASASSTVDAAKTAATTPAPAAPAAAPAATESKSEGVSPAMLVGAGSILTSFGLIVGSVITSLAGLSIFELIMAFVALLAIIAAPFAALAWLKLRRRNLAGVLEAAGWALNEPLKLNRELGLLFTYRPPRPAGSQLDWIDGAAALAKGRSAEAEEDPDDAKRRKRIRFWLVVLLVVVLLASTGVAQSGLSMLTTLLAR